MVIASHQNLYIHNNQAEEVANHTLFLRASAWKWHISLHFFFFLAKILSMANISRVGKQSYHISEKWRARNILWGVLITSIYTHLLWITLTRVILSLIFCDCVICIEVRTKSCMWWPYKGRVICILCLSHQLTYSGSSIFCSFYNNNSDLCERIPTP